MSMYLIKGIATILFLSVFALYLVTAIMKQIAVKWIDDRWAIIQKMLSGIGGHLYQWMPGIDCSPDEARYAFTCKQRSMGMYTGPISAKRYIKKISSGKMSLCDVVAKINKPFIKRRIKRDALSIDDK